MGLLSLEVVSGGTGGGDKVRERERARGSCEIIIRHCC